MSPVLMTLGEWDVPAYGFMLALALVVAWAIVMAFGRADRLPIDRLATAFMLAVITGFVAARGAWILQHPRAMAEAVTPWSLPAGGLAPFAGVVVGLLVSASYLAWRKVPPTVAWDVAAPAFAAAGVLERVGALLAGTGAGKYAPSWPLAIRFPEGSPVFEQHRTELADLLAAGATSSLPVHPTQIYGMLLGAGGLALCLYLRRHRRFSGQVFLAYGIYAIATRAFVEEWFRADAPQAVFGPLSGGQLAAAVLVIALAVVLRTRGMRAAGRRDGLRLWEGGRWSPDGSGRSPAPTEAAEPVVAKPSSSSSSSSGGPSGPKRTATSRKSKRGKGRKRR